MEAWLGLDRGIGTGEELTCRMRNMWRFSQHTGEGLWGYRYEYNEEQVDDWGVEVGRPGSSQVVRSQAEEFNLDSIGVEFFEDV